MSIILKQPITGPAAWSGPDLESETSWLRPLTPDIIDGLDSALAALKVARSNQGAAPPMLVST